jgi:hypothetical protein
VSTADGTHAGLREPEVADLARLDELLDGAGDVLDGDRGVDPVLVEEVDAVGAQAAQGRLGDLLDVLGSTGEAVLVAVSVDVEAELGCDDDRSRTGASASPTSSSLVNGP